MQGQFKFLIIIKTTATATIKEEVQQVWVENNSMNNNCEVQYICLTAFVCHIITIDFKGQTSQLMNLGKQILSQNVKGLPCP